MTVKSSISLTDEQHSFAKEMVEAGRYSSVSAVLQQGIDLRRQRMQDEDLQRVADGQPTALHFRKRPFGFSAAGPARYAPLLGNCVLCIGFLSLRAIATELTARGIQTRRGGAWGFGNVKGLLGRMMRPS